MKIGIAIVVVVAIVWLVISVVRSRNVDANAANASEYTTIDRIPLFVAKLRKTGKNGSFVVFMFEIPGKKDEIFPNIQYSIESDKLGFDWVLIAPQNVKDEEAISSFLSNQGFVVSTREMNDVRYLRVEGGDMEALGGKVLHDFYHLAPDTKLELIVEGFDLKE